MNTNNTSLATGDGPPAASFNITIACAAPDAETRLRSALEQSGLDFRLLPLSAPQGRAMSVEGPAALRPGGAGAPTGEARAGPRLQTLLLVDDEYNIIAALRRVLRREGYRILAATSGEQGLTLLADNEVDVIVSDQRMPTMTGVEFLRRARALRPNAMRIVLS
ncbi:MAG: response regulator, partial [Betaproteobacteria bacterium]